MPSLSYQLIKFVIYLKGIKKIWSTDPIDYIKYRKEDIHQPKKNLLSGNSITSFTIDKSVVTELIPKSKASENLIIYVHGGGFIHGPVDVNWVFSSKIAKNTQTTTWLIDYPKAPEVKIEEINCNIFSVYKEAIKKYDASKITLIGDSAGGNLIIGLTQKLIQKNMELPKRLIPICPVIDASMTNSQIDLIDKKDIILSKKGLVSANKMCAGNLLLTNPKISSIYGSYKRFPKVYLFIADNDILMPDTKLAAEKMKKEHVNVTVFKGKGMPHVWPLLPFLSEATIARKQIESILINETESL